MTRKFLEELGLEKEAIDKIMSQNGKDIENAKGDITAVTAERDSLKKDVEERDKQINTLKESAGSNEELKKQIETFTQQNKDQKAAYEKEIAMIKLTAAVDAELTAAGSKNNIAVRAMLADFLKDAKVEDGKVMSKENGEAIPLSAKVEAMKKDATTDFMFGTAPRYNGWKPGESGDGSKPGSDKKLSEMTYSELTDYLAQNPETKLE